MPIAKISSKANSLLELRALLELASAFPAKPLTRYLPEGDGHPVLVIPAFMTNDAFTSRFRRSLRDLGYSVKPWGLGANLGVRLELIEQCVEKLQSMYRKHGRKVSVIGWSLGGIYARAVGNLCPEAVRQVITLGSPFAASLETKAGISGGMASLYNLLNKRQENLLDHHHLTHNTPDCGFTSIFTATDGVVDYGLCLDRNSDLSQNIQVGGSHAGLTHNPLVFWLVANRLLQAEEAWQPMEFNGLSRLLYRSVDVDKANPRKNAILAAELASRNGINA